MNIALYIYYIQYIIIRIANWKLKIQVYILNVWDNKCSYTWDALSLCILFAWLVWHALNLVEVKWRTFINSLAQFTGYSVDSAQVKHKLSTVFYSKPISAHVNLIYVAICTTFVFLNSLNKPCVEARTHKTQTCVLKFVILHALYLYLIYVL